MTIPISLPYPLVPLNSPKANLETVGGKGTNLSKLARAGFAVPAGFMIPTESYRQYVQANSLDCLIRDLLGKYDSTCPQDLQTMSAEIRTQFERNAVSPSLINALGIGCLWLGAHSVAVRSSATAEDLPDMSFAGQQDTFLNVIGQDALLEAVVACWSSLWTARAIGYRSRNGIPNDERVALAVVVQKMIPAEASGVLFTANPLSGCRVETVIDATLGLGEALVGGHVQPDHYVISNQASASHPASITHKFRGTKYLIITGKPGGGTITQKADAATRQAIPDEIILQLAVIGRKIEALYDFPQDIEWAYSPSTPTGMLCEGARGEGQMDRDEGIHVLQSRLITSLFPLPDGLPIEPLRTLIGFHAIQGIVEPITPLGQDVMKMVLVNISRVFGRQYDLEKQTGILSAAERLWINMTPIIHHPIGRKVYPTAIKSIDPGVAQAFRETILKDPRFALEKQHIKPGTVWRIARFVFPFLGRVVGLLLNPERGRLKAMRLFDDKVAETNHCLTSSGDLWADYAQRLTLLHEAENLFADIVIPKGAPPVVAGMMPFFGILQRFSAKTEQPLLYLEIARGLPHNVTTEMDLFLWETAQAIQADAESARIFAASSASELACAYQSESLPPAAQTAISTFMERYGMRGLGEIDFGRPRLREQPQHIIQTLQSYLTISDPDKAPDVVFARGAEAAQQAISQLEAAVRKLKWGWLKAALIRLAAGRYRALAGMREAPKFFAIRMLSIFRQGLLESNRAFVEAGLLEQPDDLFF
ncbi:MAG: PEP/pyruvate-binding domain-containing protein, partial [Chloroflexota bacterium]|nr:PEP/pyruvate-binding domain-containing protein [Chloroflexota bacterium]